MTQTKTALFESYNGEFRKMFEGNLCNKINKSNPIKLKSEDETNNSLAKQR